MLQRDIAHAKIKELLDSGKPMPEYFKITQFITLECKTPEGMPKWKFQYTTAGRMDVYVDEFQANGGNMIMLAKGNEAKM